MSLIADALKKAQSARLGRRYLSPDPSGVLPGSRQGGGGGGLASFGDMLSRLNVSPILVVGLGSGVLLFALLFAYFFYSRPAPKPAKVASLPAMEKKPIPLILTPPPSVPATEPLLEQEKAPPGTGFKEAVREKGSPSKETLEAKKRRGSGAPEMERKPKPTAKARESKGTTRDTRVAVTTDLSEEVRYHFNLALFYQEEGNFPLARRAYEKVVEMWPLYAEAHNNLGVVYKELGIYEQAIAQLRKAVALNPRYPRAYHNLGVVYQLKGDWKQAVKNYEMALSLDRNHLSSYNNLGLVHRAQKRPHEAREALEKALSINPSFPQTHYNLALVLEEIGEAERARFHYQKFVDLSGSENSRLVERVRVHLQELAGKR